MEESKLNKVYQVYVNIAEICYQKGIRYAVLSPGSRSAVLALVFLRHPGIKTYTVVDERSAAFKAVGIAQYTGQPTILACTSGTAGLNYGPAIAEAFWQGTPLLTFTADRPPEWIDQGENQTIFQEYIYGKNMKGAFFLPSDFEEENQAWRTYRQINESINLANASLKGPVHINAPFREPLYPESPLPKAEEAIPLFSTEKTGTHLPDVLHSKISRKLKESSKTLVLAGLNKPDPDLQNNVKVFVQRNKAVLIIDPISNCHEIDEAISHGDLIAHKAITFDNHGLTPDILISFGGPIISKQLKEFFRQNKPSEHWHISANGDAPDTYQGLTSIIPMNPTDFFGEMGGKFWPKPDNSYQEHWIESEYQVKESINGVFQNEENFSELSVLNQVFQNLPDSSILHLGNSLPVRHAEFLGINSENYPKELEVYSNRGTSGIDGVLSTAVGFAQTTDKFVTVILGDLAFMYDRNALWDNHLPANLRIIILNNNGGGIFRILKGAKDQPELEDYFASAYSLNFESTARQHNCEYRFIDNWEKLTSNLSGISQNFEKPLILEISFDNEVNFAAQQSIKDQVLKNFSL